MKKFYLSILFLLNFAFFFKANAFALSFQNNQLSIDVQTKETNDGLDVLFDFSLYNGWHISWQNPGDAGVPTKFEFSNAASKLENSSIPIKFVYEDVITQYGFSDKAYYLFHLSELSENPSVHVSWAVCRDYCEPQETVFEIKKQTSPLFEKVLQKAKETFPQLIEKPVFAKIKNNKLTLFIKDFPFDISYFIPSEPSILRADAEQLIQKDRIVVQTQKNKLPSFGIFMTSHGAYKAFISSLKPNIFILLLLAFLGGLILNLMPCVFPVLSLKALSMIQSVHSNDHHFSKAFFYTLGVILSFLLIAGALFLLKSGGAALGWGFQLQSPSFVLLMIILFVLILIFLFDFVHINLAFLNTFSKLSEIHSFFTGFFAVLIASPCTGPFMGAAVGYALFESPQIYFPVFLSLGLGYALPFAMLEMFPKIMSRILPKPGKWMQTVKYVLSVPIFLTVFWLCWVFFYQIKKPSEINLWHPYEKEAVETALENGESVFIDFTAKWCLTCLLNERTTLNSDDFKNIAKEKQIRLFKADWTNQDKDIFEALKYFGRSSVPLYVFYPEDNDEYIILPQLLTPNIVLSVINEQN